MTQVPGNQVMIVFNSRSASRRMVIGPATKKNYGYRKHGDTFKVFESDVRVRPDLYRPVGNEKVKASRKPKPVSPVIAKAESVSVKAPQPPPPPPPTLLEDEEPVVEKYLSLIEWDKINDRHIKILMDNKIATIHDVHGTTEEELLAIKGIGPVIAKELKEKGKEYPLVL